VTLHDSDVVFRNVFNAPVNAEVYCDFNLAEMKVEKVFSVDRAERECVDAIARRFDAKNPSEVQALARNSRFSVEGYRQMWVAITAAQECPSSKTLTKPWEADTKPTAPSPKAAPKPDDPDEWPDSPWPELRHYRPLWVCFDKSTPWPYKITRMFEDDGADGTRTPANERVWQKLFDEGCSPKASR
jgi:hypothetical protein